MTYWRLYYHLVWATKHREPLIDHEIEMLVQRSFRATCHDLRVVVHAIGAMPDHVHLAVSIPPNIAISDAARRLKGSASHLINATGERGFTFGWQPEFGVLSFGERHLPDVVGYVDNQPARHAAGRLWATMEPGILGPPSKTDPKGPDTQERMLPHKTSD